MMVHSDMVTRQDKRRKMVSLTYKQAKYIECNLDGLGFDLDKYRDKYTFKTSDEAREFFMPKLKKFLKNRGWESLQLDIFCREERDCFRVTARRKLNRKLERRILKPMDYARLETRQENLFGSPSFSVGVNESKNI
jgi:hypothetical protein